MHNTTLILTKSQIGKLVDIKRAIRAIEKAFKEYAKGKTQMPPKIYLDLKKYSGDFRAMPAYLEGQNACILKWVNVHARNKGKGLPTVMATIIYSDPKTGFPLAIMDGTYATSLRTAAAGAVAAKYLANKDSCVIGLVGCGAQATTQLAALRTLFKIKQVKVWGHKPALSNAFVRAMKKPGEQMTRAKTVRECVDDCDIIVTTTPSRRPLVRLEWVKKGAHINAIGADAAGKQELDARILKSARVIIDNWEQAAHSGEINVPLRKKVISRRNIHAEIGEVIIGKKKGRVSKDDVTVFDSTGLAIQDAAIAKLIYTTAVKRNIGKRIKLI